MFIKKSKKITPTEKIGIAFLFISAMVVLLLCFSKGISGNDFWWHIKVGEYIQENKHVPTSDIFSWLGMEKNISWTAHEWLSDIVFYYIYCVSGQAGIFCFSVFAAILLFALLFFESIKYIKNNIIIGGAFFIPFSIVVSLFAYGRPHIFSFFFLFFELKILFDFFENGKFKKLCFVPIISILWSNFHGGSAVLSYLLPMVFLIVSLMQIRCGRVYAQRLSNKKIVAMLFVTVGAVIGLLVNPVGLKVLIYPYTSFGDTLMMNIISEWQAPDAKVLVELILYFIPIAIITLGMLTTQEDIRAIDVAVMGVFLLLFFRSARFIMLWYIAAVFFAFRYMPICKFKEIKKKRDIIIVSLASLLFIIPVVSFFNDVVETYKKGQLISTVMSEAAVVAVKEDSPKRIFNDYNLGEALIYNDIPVFFDARADLYAQEHIMEDGISLMCLEQMNTEAKDVYVDVESVMSKYEFDAILILKSRPLYAYLTSHPDKYACKYSDENIGYFRVVLK